MNQAYNRNDVLGSMKTTMAKETAAAAAPASEPSKKSAESSTTAEAKAKEKTPAESSAGEGGAAGTDDKNKGGDASGSQDTKSKGTTADEDEGTSSDEKAPEGDDDGEAAGKDDESKPKEEADESAGKLEEEEAKALEAWGLKDFKPTAENRKLLKIAKDNQAKVQEYQQTAAATNDYMAALGNSLVNHDIENLNAIVQELGGDKIPFDLRTEEDQVKEITDNYNAFYDALEKSLPAEVFAQVQKALAPVHSETQKKLGVLEKKLLIREAGVEAAKKAGNVPVKGKYLDNLKGKADKNFVELFKADAKAKDNMKILEPIFKLGTDLQNPSKAYAMAPQVVNELGEALDFKRNFQTKYLPDLQKQWEAAAKLKRAAKPPPSGNKGESRGTGDSSSTPSGINHNRFVGARLLQKHGPPRK
jgi:hypothetical protein